MQSVLYPRRDRLYGIVNGVDYVQWDPSTDKHLAANYGPDDLNGKLTCKRAKITGLHFHDLRREAGSRWMDAGIPLATIQRWLGHANISQTSTYLGASIGGDEQDMKTFEERIGRIQPLTQTDVLPGSTSSEGTSTDLSVLEKSPQNTTVH